MFNKNTEVVKFGNYNGNPLEWYVINEDERSYCLLAKECITTREFNEELYNNYKQSDIRKFLLGLVDECFSEKEQELLLPHDELQDKIFLLSKEEAEHLPHYIRCCDKWWWLRSPHPTNCNYALIASTTGRGSYARTHYSYGGVRPAVCVKKSLIDNQEYVMSYNGKDYTKEDIKKLIHYKKNNMISKGDDYCPLCGCEFGEHDLFVCEDCGQVLHIDLKYKNTDYCEDCVDYLKRHGEYYDD